VGQEDALVAVLVEVNVNVLVPVAGLVPKAAVVPAPMPVAESVTAPVNPPEGVMVTVVAPVAPRATLTLVGEALKAKLGVAAALTVRLTAAVCVRLPEVPVIVTEAVPVVAVELAVKVSVLVVVAGFGLKAAVTPVGKPVAVIVTLLVNPFKRVMVTVLVPLAPPLVIVTLVGDAASEKFAVAVVVTVRATVVVWDRDPDLPVIVTVVPPAAGPVTGEMPVTAGTTGGGGGGVAGVPVPVSVTSCGCAREAR